MKSFEKNFPSFSFWAHLAQNLERKLSFAHSRGFDYNHGDRRHNGDRRLEDGREIISYSVFTSSEKELVRVIDDSSLVRANFLLTKGLFLLEVSENEEEEAIENVPKR